MKKLGPSDPSQPTDMNPHLVTFDMLSLLLDGESGGKIAGINGWTNSLGTSKKGDGLGTSKKVPEERAIALYLSQGAHVGGAEAVGKAICKRESVKGQNWRQPAMKRPAWHTWSSSRCPVVADAPTLIGRTSPSFRGRRWWTHSSGASSARAFLRSGYSSPTRMMR